MFKSETISKLKKEITQKYTVVYEFDLKNAIDYEKSPRNEIKQTEDYCEFVCEKGAEIPFGEIEVIFGRLEEKEGYFEGKIQEQSFYKSEGKNDFDRIFSAVLPFSAEYDIINVSFKGNTEQCFKMSAYGDYVYQVKRDIKTEVFESIEDNSYKNRMASSYYVDFSLESPNNVTVFVTHMLSDYIVFKYSSEEMVSFYLDYKLQKININGQKWRQVYDAGIDKLNHFEIKNSFQKNTISFENEAFHIYKAEYAKNKGYIYLKTIILQEGIYKLFAFHTGEITIEYFKDKEWKMLPEEFRFTEKGNLSLRIKMDSGIKLYDLFIVK